MGTRQYCPELVARPYWYQSMPDKSLLDARIAQIMSNPSATGTACCLRPLSGRNKGTSEVVCATGRGPPPPRVRPVTPAAPPGAAPPAAGPAVPGDQLKGWPLACSGKPGLSVTKIQQLLGPGGQGPVTLGKGTYVQRTRECTQVRKSAVKGAS
jgi:hypothetical protein